MNTALYFLDDSRSRIDRLFADIGNNNDVAATRLARELMDQREAFPENAPLSELSPLPREFGSELTSGRKTDRVDLDAPVQPTRTVDAPSDGNRVA